MKFNIMSISLEEVQSHETESDIWVIINQKIYDCTNFLNGHPGGKKAILIYAGRDAAEEFDMLHSPNVLTKYLAESAFKGHVKMDANL